MSVKELSSLSVFTGILWFKPPFNSRSLHTGGAGDISFLMLQVWRLACSVPPKDHGIQSPFLQAVRLMSVGIIPLTLTLLSCSMPDPCTIIQLCCRVGMSITVLIFCWCQDSQISLGNGNKQGSLLDWLWWLRLFWPTSLLHFLSACSSPLLNMQVKCKGTCLTSSFRSWSLASSNRDKNPSVQR